MVRRFFGLVIIFFVWLVPASAKQGAAQNQNDQDKDGANSPQVAVIENSGSTNTPGYRLIVHASGSAEWAVSRRRHSPACSRNAGKLPSELTQRFFEDLRQLMPLSKLPVGQCAKSVSFGTTLRVTYQGSTSPDLSCPASGNETDQLLNDLAAINKALGVNANVRGLPSACEQATPAPNP
jgi:hypothetical protein